MAKRKRNPGLSTLVGLALVGGVGYLIYKEVADNKQTSEKKSTVQGLPQGIYEVGVGEKQTLTPPLGKKFSHTWITQGESKTKKNVQEVVLPNKIELRFEAPGSYLVNAYYEGGSGGAPGEWIFDVSA